MIAAEARVGSVVRVRSDFRVRCGGMRAGETDLPLIISFETKERDGLGRREQSVQRTELDLVCDDSVRDPLCPSASGIEKNNPNRAAES